MTVNISIDVKNLFIFPKEAEAFAREQERMSSNLEDGPNFTEEEVLLVTALEGDCPVEPSDKSLKFIDKTVRQISTEFPNLVFAMDVKAIDPDGEIGAFIRREYFENGERQVVFPYTVVPDLDPEGEFD